MTERCPNCAERRYLVIHKNGHPIHKCYNCGESWDAEQKPVTLYL